MNILSTPLLTLFALVTALPALASAVRPGAALAPALAPARCAPAPKPAVPPDYLFYHALVAPHAALSDRRPAACAAHKVVRT